MRFREHPLVDEPIPGPVPGVGVPYRNGNTGTPLEPPCSGTAREHLGISRNNPRQTLALDLTRRSRNKSLAPPARAARKVSEPASGTRPRSPSPLAVSPTFARTRSAGHALPACGSAGHTGQRGRKQADPGPPRPGGCRDGPFPLRASGLQPGAPLQAFENAGLAGRVRRGVRMLSLSEASPAGLGNSSLVGLVGQFGEPTQGPVRLVEFS
jgi:hypothetical protein